MSANPQEPQDTGLEEPLAPVLEDEQKGLPALIWGSGLCLAVVILVANLLLQ